MTSMTSEELQALAEKLYVPNLRDRFAMAALNAVLMALGGEDAFCEALSHPEEYAEIAYQVADAMLDEREKGKG